MAVCCERREAYAPDDKTEVHHWELVMPKKKLGPAHPGEVLLEEFLRPMGLSQSRLALSIGVHPRRVNEIVLGKRGITADSALRLAKFFGNSARFWLGLQMDYDLDVASDALGRRLDHEVRLPTPAP
jgi:addiction module HigA family antidote